MGKLIRKLLHLLDTGDGARLPLVLALAVCAAFIETLGVALVPAFVALLTSPEDVLELLRSRGLGWMVEGRPIQRTILWASVGLAGFFGMKNGFLLLVHYVQTHFAATQQTKLSYRLLAAYLHSPYTFHLTRNTAELLRNISLEIPRVFIGVLNPLLLLISELVVVSFIALLLFAVEPVTSAVAVATIGGSALLYYRLIRGRFGAWGRIQQYHGGEMLKWVNQSLGGAKETKILGRERFFLDAFRSHVLPFVRAFRLEQTMNHFPRLLIETVAISGMMVVIAGMLLAGRQAETILPGLALFAIAALRLMPSVNRMVGAATSIRYYRHAVDVVYEDVLALEEPPRDANLLSSSPGKGIPFTHAIELRDVHYRYPGAGHEAVRGVSLTIRKGQSAAFVGPSGSGKTTLVDVILGLLPPTRGEVWVDGRNILDILGEWHQKVGYIPQSVYLADDSVRRNVAFGIPDEAISDDDVWRALEAAQLAELIKSLPEQLETFVGERGIRLSGGQRQRIGIARAMYHDPEVLVMDEATSALDHHTEREITEVLDSFHGEKTMIVIAHRLSTVQRCDVLFFMKEAEVLQSGSYAELLAECSEFQMMVA